MSSISSDLYEEILKPSKSHTNRIIQIVPFKTAFNSEQLLFSELFQSQRLGKYFFIQTLNL